MMPSEKGRIRAALERIKSFFKRATEPPPPAEDPYAYVTAPRKPRPSARSAAAVADRPEE
jgi:hypothetical protein